MTQRILHHGLCKHEFEPIYTGTDYFCFVHKPCSKSGELAVSDIAHCLIDNNGRIIFNLKCRICGATDALKTHPFFWRGKDRPELEHVRIFKLSPKLKPCVKRHGWDNL